MASVDLPFQNSVMDDATKKIFDDETSEASAKRVVATDLQGHDEIIAISEETLNTTLRFRFSNLLKKNKDKRLRQFNHALPQFGEIKAELAAPHLKLAVDNAPETVRFFLNFQSGTFQYWVGAGLFASKRSQSVAGWSIALNIRFSQEQLATVPAAIQKKVSLMNPGSYSVSQIVLGLSAASLASFDEESSVFPGVSSDKDVKIIVLNAFKQYLEPYLSWLRTGPFSVLGYVIKVDKGALPTDGLPPSFPPTAVRVRTQAYNPQTAAFREKFPETKCPSALPTRGGLDALLFLEMTQDRGWPGHAYDETKAGNWVAGGVDCSLTLSKVVFWDQYLTKQFARLNELAVLVSNETIYLADPTLIKDRSPGAKQPWIASETKPGTDWTIRASEATYDFTGTYTRGSTKISTTVGNSMRWNPGTDTVDIRCRIATPRNTSGLFSDLNTSVSMEWTLKLHLGTIKGNELKAEIFPDTPRVFAEINGGLISKGEFAEFYQKLVETRITTVLDIKSITASLTDALNGKTRFVFPGAGDFALRDPKFNQRGDLLATLQMQGQAIEVDDDFHLQAAAPGQPDIDQKWVKVSRDGDDADLVLVATQAEATLFQLSNGDLVVDVDKMPAGQRARARDAGTERPEGQEYMLQDIFFDTPATAKSRPGDKPEFSTTGSGFFYSVDKGQYWWPRFVLEGGKLRLFIGNAPDEGTQIGVKPFLLTAVY